MSNQYYNDDTDGLNTTKELKSNGRCPTCGERIIKEITSDQSRVFNKGMYVFERSNNDSVDFEIICPRCLQHIILTFNKKKSENQNLD